MKYTNKQKNSIRLYTGAIALTSLSLLVGCNDHSAKNDYDAKTNETSAPFIFTAKVQHNEAAGSTYIVSQPQSNINIEGTVTNDGLIEVSVPSGAKLDFPLQLSVALNIDTYKYMSPNIASLSKISAQKRASKRSNTMDYSDTANGNVTNVVSLESTAQFALADSDQSGFLSEQEIQHQAAQSAEADYELRVQDLMIAAEVAKQDSSKLYYQTTYELMAEFVRDESTLNAFFASNSESVKLAKETLFNLATPLNEETSSFLRLDKTAWPLKDQSLEYVNSPWSCVDDIRRVSSRDYGIRLWHEPQSTSFDHTQIQNLIATSNTELLCSKSTWRLPSVSELSSLFKGSDIQFPNTFPSAKSDDYYWVTTENSETTLVSFVSGTPVTHTPSEGSTAKVLLHSFEPVEVWRNIEAVDTPVDLNSLREIYAESPENWPTPTIDDGVEWQELGLLKAVHFPADNPYTKEKTELGKALFFDKRLSQDNTISCASCHEPEQGWADGVRRAIGINGQVGPRNTPTIINTAYYETLFLDGRVSSLEEQSLHPIANPIEMGLAHDDLLQKLDKISEYPDLFTAAFGDDTITLDRIAKAIATFERTIISTESDFDRFLKGDKEALTNEQLHGLHLFRTKARCMNCHSGPMMTNNQFENIGLTYYGRSLEDRGRYNVTYNPQDMGKFRVPMLRDIKSTDPTTHLGLFNLATVTSTGRVVGLLAMYNNGMTRNRSGNFPQYAGKYDKNFPSVSPLIERLQLTAEELIALDAFMAAISSDVRTDSATPEEMGIQ